VLRKAAQHTLGVGARHSSVRLQGVARRPPNTRAVDLARPLLMVSVLLALAPPASAAPDAGSGGALAQPLRQGEGGGALAPDRHGPSAAYGSSAAGGAPVAESAQEERPTTPRAEGAPAPQHDVGDEPESETPVAAVEEQSVAGAEAADAEGETSAGKTASNGFLPFTGLEIAALAALGLGLLTLGAALRPRRREHARVPR
jgi:hypothetical protein